MKLDSKRRVVLPKAAAELGEEFVTIEIKKEGEKLKGLSRHKLRKEIYKRALREVK